VKISNAEQLGGTKKRSVHENVMFSPDAVRSNERFTRATPSTGGRAESKFLCAAFNL
jgi:hypothetical protein